MKVCLINTYDLTGGAAVACRRLLHALNSPESGVQARMLVAMGTGDHPAISRLDADAVERWKAKARIAAERLYFRPFHNGRVNAFYFSPANVGADITDHPAVQEADVLHLHWINLGFLSLNGLRKLASLGKPIVWTLHDMWAFTGGCHYSGDCRRYTEGCGNCPFLKRPHEGDLSHRLNREKRFLADFRFVTCSEWLASEALSSSLLRNAAVSAIPNPLDMDTYSPGDKREARRSLGLDPDGKYLLFGAANLTDERKGFAYLQRALDTLASKKDGREPELLIFGKGAVAQTPFRTHNLGSLASDAALATAYRAADVFVLPSLQDNLPNTVAEAMACGTPVVAFNTGGLPEMIDHGVNGWLAPLRDADGLARGISNLLELPEAGQRAREKALAMYHPAGVAARYRAVYESLEQ